MAMTRSEFVSACKQLGYTIEEFAIANGVAPSTAYQWGKRYGIPRWVGRILELERQKKTTEAVTTPSPKKTRPTRARQKPPRSAVETNQ